MTTEPGCVEAGGELAAVGGGVAGGPEPGGRQLVGQRVQAQEPRGHVQRRRRLGGDQQGRFGQVGVVAAHEPQQSVTRRSGHAPRLPTVPRASVQVARPSLAGTRDRRGGAERDVDVVEVQHHRLEAGTVLEVTLTRPHARNAMDSALLAAFADVLHDVPGDPDLRGVLVTGAGGHFSAGADLREALDDGGRRRMELFTTVYQLLTDCPVPTAAAVEGYAVGGGAEVAAACDVRVAGRGASFRFPGAIHGVPVGVARTVGLVGLSTAKDWVLASRDVPAEEAAAAGFVQRVVDDGAARAGALDWLGQVAGRDPATVRLLKRLFNDASGGLRDRVAFENDALRTQAETGALPDLDRDLPRTVRPRWR
ncbi:enoyl-CoA hydratase/isomerase family protein [Nitriliruptoraceae bacterium ZYF776]|nr:enoyl-CoA hydratase/isomerase family protein [Profundirhabdus halotolerans]